MKRLVIKSIAALVLFAHSGCALFHEEPAYAPNQRASDTRLASKLATDLNLAGASMQHFVDNQGVSIEYLLLKGEGSSPPAVIIPGMLASADDVMEEMSDLIQTLRENAKRSIIVISLRGRGQSTTPERGWGVDSHASDIATVLDAENIQHCHLVGHSAGAVYALAYALEHPTRVSSLTIGDYFPSMPKLDRAWADNAKSDADRNSVALIDHLVQESERIDFSEQLGALTCPVLIMHGSEAYGTMLNDAHTGIYASVKQHKIVKLPEAGHDDIFGNAHPGGHQSILWHIQAAESDKG